LAIETTAVKVPVVILTQLKYCKSIISGKSGQKWSDKTDPRLLDVNYSFAHMQF